MYALIADAQSNATIVFVVAAIVFLIAAVLAWFVEPRSRAFTAVAVGLIFISIGLIIMVHPDIAP